MRKLMLVLVVFLFAVSVAFGSGEQEGKEGGKKQVELTIWGWDFRATKDVAEQTKAFEEKYPSVTINAMNMGADDLFDKLNIAIVSGSGAPDICFNVDTQVQEFYSQDVFYDLSEFLPGWENNFVPAISYRWSYEGKLYGAPYDMGPFVTFYRKDIFDQLGIDFESNVTSWEKWIEIGNKVTVPNERYMGAFYGGGHFNAISWAAKAKITDRNNSLLFDNPKAQEVAQGMVDAVNKHGVAEYADYFDPAGYEKIKAGRWITVPTWFWYQSFGLKDLSYTEELDGSWRIARALPWKEGDPPTGAGFHCGGLWVVPKQTENPDLAIELAASFATKEAQVNQSKSRGIFPVNVEAQEVMANEYQDPFFGGQDTYRIGLDQMKDAMSVGFGGKWPIIEQALNNAMDRMMLDGVPVKKALTDAKNQAAKEME